MDKQLFSPINELKWLFFDLNSYFASVEQQENPALIGRPVAVVPMMTDSTCAIAASYEAKAFGIKTGTKIYEAKRRCPELVCVLARHDLYVQYHTRILDELEQHIPVTKVCSIDEAACKLFKNERTYAKAHDLALKIKKGFYTNVGEIIRCSIGIAPNAYLAKVATELEKPDGLVILEPGSYKDRLFTLKLRDLPGINRGIESRLFKAGIQSIEQFWYLSPKQARHIWGSIAGEQFWYRLRGYEIPDRQTQKRMIGHSRILDPSLRNPQDAYAITRQLTTKAATRLRRYDLHGKQFALSVKTVHRQRWGSVQILLPTQDNFDFINALAKLWKAMLYDLGNQNIKAVSIVIYNLCEQKKLTLDMFDEKPTLLKNEQLTKTIDQINRRFGAGTTQLGLSTKTQAGYVGTKIAFNRIPEQAEFNE